MLKDKLLVTANDPLPEMRRKKHCTFFASPYSMPESVNLIHAPDGLGYTIFFNYLANEPTENTMIDNTRIVVGKNSKRIRSIVISHISIDEKNSLVKVFEQIEKNKDKYKEDNVDTIKTLITRKIHELFE